MRARKGIRSEVAADVGAKRTSAGTVPVERPAPGVVVGPGLEPLLGGGADAGRGREREGKIARAGKRPKLGMPQRQEGGGDARASVGDRTCEGMGEGCNNVMSNWCCYPQRSLALGLVPPAAPPSQVVQPRLQPTDIHRHVCPMSQTEPVRFRHAHACPLSFPSWLCGWRRGGGGGGGGGIAGDTYEEGCRQFTKGAISGMLPVGGSPRPDIMANEAG